jgi:hypothetical protein
MPMRFISPDDVPRIKIIDRPNQHVPEFHRSYVQIFLGHCIPEDWPFEEFAVGGWKLRAPAEELRPPA